MSSRCVLLTYDTLLIHSKLTLEISILTTVCSTAAVRVPRSSGGYRDARPLPIALCKRNHMCYSSSETGSVFPTARTAKWVFWVFLSFFFIFARLTLITRIKDLKGSLIIQLPHRSFPPAIFPEPPMPVVKKIL